MATSGFSEFHFRRSSWSVPSAFTASSTSDAPFIFKLRITPHTLQGAPQYSPSHTRRVPWVSRPNGTFDASTNSPAMKRSSKFSPLTPGSLSSSALAGLLNTPLTRTAFFAAALTAAGLRNAISDTGSIGPQTERLATLAASSSSSTLCFRPNWRRTDLSCLAASSTTGNSLDVVNILSS